MSSKEPVTKTGALCGQRGRIPETCVELNQIVGPIRKSGEQDSLSASPALTQHDVSFEGVINSNANDVTTKSFVAPTQNDAKKLAGEDEADISWARGSMKGTNSPATRQSSDATKNGVLLVESDGPLSARDKPADAVHQPTMDASVDQIGVDDGEKSQLLRASTASPITAMVQGLTQPTDTAANDTNAAGSSKSSQVGITRGTAKSLARMGSGATVMTGSDLRRADLASALSQKITHSGIGTPDTSNGTATKVQAQATSMIQPQSATEIAPVRLAAIESDKTELGHNKVNTQVRSTQARILETVTGQATKIFLAPKTNDQKLSNGVTGLPGAAQMSLEGTRSQRHSDAFSSPSAIHVRQTDAPNSLEMPAATQVSPAARKHGSASPPTIQSIAASSGFVAQLATSGDQAGQPEEFVWDLRPVTSHSNTTTTLSLQRAELPHHVSQAIAEALHRASNKAIEIALNPAELGRVRMTMATNEAGIVVIVTAERGDTLDLMRRNIDDLGKSLSNLGFEDVSFAFEQGQYRSDGHVFNELEDAEGQIAEADQTLTINPTINTRIGIIPPLATTGIDMRF